MPFLTLNNNWSNLAPLYNQRFNNKPEVPTAKYSTFDDGLIRGGLINAGLASAKDTLRIGKFLASPNGLLFVTKQIGLQLTNPQLESQGEIKTTSNPNNSQKVTTLSYKKNNPTRTYLGLNTITQIPLNAFGGHIIRHGILPVGGGGFLENSTDNINGYNYEKIVKQNNQLSIPPTKVITNTTNSNSETKSGNNTSSTFGPNVIDNSNANPKDFSAFIPPTDGRVLLYASPDDLINKRPSILASSDRLLGTITVTGKNKKNIVLSYNNAPNRLIQHLKVISEYSKDNKYGQRVLLSYNGGANSAYGLGDTIIKTSADQRTDSDNNRNDPKYVVNNGAKFLNYVDLDQASVKLSSNVDRQSTTSNPIDLITQDNSLNSNISNYNIEKRIGISRVGKSIKRSVDSINTISILSNGTFYNWAAQATTPNSVNSNSTLFTYTKGSEGKSNGGSFARDIIKFRIEFIDNNRAGDFTEVLTFRAYIDEFSDGMNAKWNPYRYMGRGEEFYVYDGFTRDISLGFTMYAHSPEEMRPLYQKLNYLMSTFTPDYNDKLKMRGNIAKLTVGDYLYQQPGIFTDIKLSGFLDTHWEIALDEPEGGSDSQQYEVPKHIKVNLSFKPIHNFLPRRVMADNPNRAPFITRNDINNKYLTNGDTRLAPTTQEEFNNLPPRVENPSSAGATSLNLTNQAPTLTLNNTNTGTNLWGSF